MIFFDYDINEFLDKFSKCNIMPVINTEEIKNLISNKRIFITEIITESDKSPYYFLELINSIKKNDICFVINYTIYKNDLTILTTNYKGEILFDSKNENRVYLEVNNTLIGKELTLDWFDIWGHACEGWVMNNIAYHIFKKVLNNNFSEHDIKEFLDNLTFKFEFGDIHESIRFISFSDELKKLFHEDGLNNYLK